MKRISSPRLTVLASCIAAAALYGCSSPARSPVSTGGSGGSGGDSTGGLGVPAPTGGSGGSVGAGGSGGVGGSGGDLDAAPPPGGDDAAPITSDAGDEAGADASPADDGSAGTGGTVNPGGPILLVIADDPEPAPNNGMMMELMSKGLKFVVQNTSMMPLTPDSATGKSLVIINPNTPRGNVPASFKDVPVPVIVSKDGPATQMMMATGVGSTDPGETAITITAPDDPLAAGFPMGSVTVYAKGNRVIFGTPTAAGKVVATTKGGPAIFYYEAGAAMVGGFKAPAKRVGFFWHRTEDVTADGRKLFSAAVAWALKP